MKCDYMFKLEQYEIPTSKTDLVIFLTDKRLLAGTIYIRFLICLIAINGKKMKGIDFSAPSAKLRFCLIFPNRRS